MNQIPKTYNPTEAERKIIEYWSAGNFFSPDSKGDRQKYSIVIPPPNVTGNLHVGHILNNTIQDIYARWKRMLGYNVLWLPGTDHAGIATQSVVEKRLREEGITRYDLGREKFIEKVWEWKEIYHANIKQQLVRMGASVDWNRERFTMDEGLSKAVRKVFVDLYKKGLIYKGKRIINWDPDAQTALSDEEVIYKEQKDKLYYIKYYLADKSGKFIPIATTRPETMLGDTAVAVNPNDKRYKEFIGKQAILPLVDRKIPIIGDDYVDMEFGTGALKITPAHDPNDFEIGQKYKLDSVQVIDQTGMMNDNSGVYKGIDRFEARRKIVQRLKELNYLIKIEDYIHNIGYSERGNTVVEPYLSDQWFVRMKTLAQPALDVVLSGEVKFYPERWVKVYEHWMTNIKDWCISRQLWWGHQIPVWYNKNTGEIYCETEPPADIENWEQDPDVLDTWFSSWLWPFSTMGWPDDTDDLKKYFPTDMLSTAPEIIFFWVARMIMASLEFTGKIPFTDVYFHSIIRDDTGRKLSKSLGNSPDVIYLMDKYGTDALRFTLIFLAPMGIDVYFSEEKCEIGRNFANKLWNACRFLIMNKPAEKMKSNVPYEKDIFDVWIQSRFNTTLKTFTQALNGYRINEASKALYDFVWRDFCDWYIEALKIKSAEYPDSKQDIFEEAIIFFEKILKILHPVIPFITEELFQSIYHRKPFESISVSVFPELDETKIQPEIEKEFEELQDLTTAIRNLRSEINLSPSVKCDVVIACRDYENVKHITDVEHYLKAFARINHLDVILADDFKKRQKLKSVTSVVGQFQVYIKVEGLINVELEKQRLQKEVARVESFIFSLEKKLQNKKFLEKASPDIVENERKKYNDNIIKLEKLKMSLGLLCDS